MNEYFSLKRITFVLIATLLLAFVVYKAFTIGITHDEAYSFKLVKTLNIKQMGGTANNHWLNSIGIFLFSNLLQSDSPGVIRLHSVISFILYSVAIFYFLSHLDQLFLRAFLLALFLLNPYVLDFFSLARGYGLCMGLQMMGFYFAFTSFKRVGRPDFNTFVWLTLAVVANYSSLYVYLSVTAVYWLSLIFTSGKHLKQWDKYTIALQTITIITATTNLFIIRHFGDLEYGGRDSFISSTLGSLVASSAYGTLPDNVVLLLAVLLFALLVFPAVYIIYVFIVRKKPISWISFLALTTLATILLMELLHFLFNTPYLTKRTSLVLYPLFSLTLCFYLASLLEKSKPYLALFASVGWLIIFMFIFSFFRNASYQYTFDWKEQEDTLVKIEDIYQNVKVSSKQASKVTVYLGAAIGPYLNYYQYLNPARYPFQAVFYTPTKMDTEYRQFRAYLSNVDYAIIAKAEEEWALKMVQRKYEVLKHYPLTESRLIHFSDENN